MRTLIALILLAAAHCGQSAQSLIHQNDAATLARKITQVAGKLPNVPFLATPEFSSATICANNDAGALLIPAQGLSRQRIQNVGDELQPLGALWFHGVKPSTRGYSPYPAAKLHAAAVNTGKKDVRFHGLILDIRKGKSGNRELLVYGKDKQPLLQLPIKSMLLHQRHPIDLAVSGNAKKGLLHLHLFGGFVGTLPIVATDSK